ncbi:MAG: tetratricopeptide repeat protein [Sandaracinaceae bacterium]
MANLLRPLALRFAAPTALVVALITPSGLSSAQETRLPSLRQRAEEAPRDYEAQRALGEALLRAARYREAERTFQAAARLRRGEQRPLYDVARVHFARREYHDARAACRNLARIDRRSALYHVCMARAFLAWGRASRAFDSVERALAVDADDYDALLALGDAHRLRASVDEAVQAYRRAIAENGRAAEPHLGLGLLYLNARRPSEGIAALRRALELDGDSPDILFELGRALLPADGGDQGAREAIPLLRRAVAGRPSFALAHAALGDALLGVGSASEAAEAYRTALGLQEDLAVARAGLGRAQAAMGQLEEAEATLRAALEDLSNDWSATSTLARVLVQRNQRQEAYDVLLRAADLDRSDTRALMQAAAMAMEENRAVYALTFLERVVAIDEDYAPALAMMGDAYASQRLRSRAADLYRQALAGQGPIDRAEVQRKLREVQ